MEFEEGPVSARVQEAFEEYKKYKEGFIRELAKEYKGKIRDCIYNAMLNWKVAITD